MQVESTCGIMLKTFRKILLLVLGWNPWMKYPANICLRKFEINMYHILWDDQRWAKSKGRYK